MYLVVVVQLIAAMDFFKYFQPSKLTLPVFSAYTVSSSESTNSAANKEIRRVPRAPYRNDTLARQFPVRRSRVSMCVMATYTMAALPIREICGSFLPYRISFG